MTAPQTYGNHRRFDPTYHFFLLLLSLGGVIFTAYLSIRWPSHHHLLALLIAIVFVNLVLKTRIYALRVQDRLIRLEETLRMQKLLPADLQARIHELSIRQMVALRFASDGELAERVREALDQKLGGEAIKKRIQTWRPDTFRV